MNIVKFTKANEDIKSPCYKTEGAAGADLRSIEDVALQPGEIRAVKTGIYVEIPMGWQLEVRPRSGLAVKHGITVLNTPGTIDSDYRGEIMVILVNHSNTCFDIHKGDRIAQLVFMPAYRCLWQQVDELSDTSRGEGGHGSTGVE